VGKTENPITLKEKVEVANSLAAEPFYVPLKVLARIF
jgi:hypothetical protein